MTDQSTSAGSARLSDLGYRQELRRGLSTTDLLVYGLVFMVPITPWAIFGTVFNEWVGPVIGFLVIGFVLFNADPAAKIGGLVWLVIGVAVLLYYNSRGIGILPEHRADPGGDDAPTAVGGQA